MTAREKAALQQAHELRVRAFQNGMATVLRCLEEGVPPERIRRAMRTLDPKPKPRPPRARKGAKR